MSSILRAQFVGLTDSEALSRANSLVSRVWRLLARDLYDVSYEEALEYCLKLQDIRKKLSWVSVLMAERGLAWDDGGALVACKQKLIDVARAKEICPVDFGETFESLSVTEPWIFKKVSSVIDMEFQYKKDMLKKAGIEFIKSNPTCAEADLQAYLDNNFFVDDASLGKYLMNRYQEWAFNRGLISSNDFISFRDFIVSTPVEVLMNL